MSQRVHLRIRGRVQGVAFRWWALREAKSRGIGGWIRNAPDGSVEVVAEGDGPALEEFVAWCRRGPPAARVSEVDEARFAATGEFSEYTVAF